MEIVICNKSILIINMYLLKPSTTNRMQHKVNFLMEYSWFEFRVFFLLDWLPNQN